MPKAGGTEGVRPVPTHIILTQSDALDALIPPKYEKSWRCVFFLDQWLLQIKMGLALDNMRLMDNWSPNAQTVLENSNSNYGIA
ncbi:hypothetical protein PROFUN_03150 [Planoprotostelium fungivorum]|uniref:Uncharacterized protein n=1 Tax=Planoprotostelium fungivorum TaxID=1890364 RepID=A0A2P6NWU8_9EUKA|nr:hypothetical protein PROFUN_03150 [Planoprotostelium fungivorum]